MNEINIVNASRAVIPFPLEAAADKPQRKHTAAETHRPSDQVELSPASIALAEKLEQDHIQTEDQIRIEKVARVRSEIHNGLYDVDSKIDAIVDRVLDDLLE